MKYFLLDGGKAPQKEDGDMCYDLFANTDSPIVLSRGRIVKIPLGIKIDFGEYHASLRERSGLASKGIAVLGGQIDSGYRGEIQVILTNLSDIPHTVNPGDKVCQMKLESDVTVDFELTSEEDLTQTNRGEDGFGSTGD